ncbi:MAG TPA: hypothetical protein VMP01_16115 [Pirellulaceae bacterium]|nr:hypothetical protein [Pirellulaceae bacterium]
MRALDHRYWPIWVAIVFLILAAAINATTQTVPNWLACASLLASWTAGWCITREQAPSVGGGMVPALLLSFLGLIILLPLDALGILAAGCVLANAALGGWIGCAVSAERGAKWLAGCAVAGALLTAISSWMFTLYGMNVDALSQVFPPQAALSAGSVLTLVAMLRLAQDAEKPAASEPAASNLPAA